MISGVDDSLLKEMNVGTQYHCLGLFSSRTGAAGQITAIDDAVKATNTEVLSIELPRDTKGWGGTVIMSLGTSPNPLISSTTIGLDTNKRKCIIADEETGKTTKEGVYAGGDAVTGAATVILAMGAGKAAAKGIDEFIKGKEN